jgi:hypothetical protein
VALNHCGISSWADVARLAKHMPVVEELYLAANNFSEMDTCGPDWGSAKGGGVMSYIFDSRKVSAMLCFLDFQYLRILDVAACGLSLWDQVRKWAALPALEDLVLDGNTHLGTVGRRVGAASEDFSTLRRLSLSSTGYG